MSRMLNSTPLARGFTIVELIVVMTVMGILSVLVFTTMNDLYRSNVNAIAVTTQISDTRGALHTIEDNLTISNSVMASYTPSSSPLGSDNATAPWTYSYPAVGASTQTLIIEAAASTDGGGGERDLIINGDTTVSPQGCTPSANSTLLYNTVIYFVKNATLYRRTINSPNPCGQPIIQKQSCAAANSSSTNCRATDAKLLENVTGLSFKYYAQASDSSPMVIDSTNANSLIPTARAVDVTVETTRRINGNDNRMAASTRVVVNNRN